MIHRQNLRMAELVGQQERRRGVALYAGQPQAGRGPARRIERPAGGTARRAAPGGQCKIGDIRHIGRAWVLPHPERASPQMAPMVQDDEIERIAVDFVTKLLEADGWKVKSVESENRGFDLIATRCDLANPLASLGVRFIEVKGRSGVGEVALTTNEYKTAERLGNDYWLYVVYNCATKPEVHRIQNPSRLAWEVIVKVEHYHIGAAKILAKGTVE